MPFFDVETWYDSPNESVAFVWLEGVNPNGQVRKGILDTRYKVISGEAIFCIDGEKHLIEVGQFVDVPKGALYQDFGKPAVMLATSHPRFDYKDVNVLGHNSLQTE